MQGDSSQSYILTFSQTKVKNDRYILAYPKVSSNLGFTVMCSRTV